MTKPVTYPQPTTCSVHEDQALVVTSFCPKCRGSVKSERKAAAARENALAPRPNARGPRKPKENQNAGE